MSVLLFHFLSVSPFLSPCFQMVVDCALCPSPFTVYHITYPSSRPQPLKSNVACLFCLFFSQFKKFLVTTHLRTLRYKHKHTKYPEQVALLQITADMSKHKGFLTKDPFSLFFACHSRVFRFLCCSSGDITYFLLLSSYEQ